MNNSVNPSTVINRPGRPTGISFAKRAVFSLVTFAAFLIVLEGIVRFMGVQGIYHAARVDSLVGNPPGVPRAEFGFFPDVTVRTTYDSDPRGYFGPGNSIDHHFNSVGWRDLEHEQPKPAEMFRILGIGDSYLYGQGVRRNDICLTKLGNLLAERVYPKVETINAAVNASNTVFQRDLLKHQGFSYDPDLVILHFVPNDVESMVDLMQPGPRIEFGTEYVSIYEQPDALSKFSHLWSWSRQKWLRHIRARKYVAECLAAFDRESSKWRQCRDAIRAIHRLCQEHNVELLVVVFPFFHELNGDYPFQPIHDLVRSECVEQGIDILDLRPTYRKYRGPELWVHPTDQHPNEIAHDLAANEIANYLGTRLQLMLKDAAAGRK